MSHRRIGALLMVGVVGLSASAADAQLAVFDEWSTMGAGQALTPRANGLGIMAIESNGADMTVTVLAVGLEPNTTYSLMVLADTDPMVIAPDEGLLTWAHAPNSLRTNWFGIGLVRFTTSAAPAGWQVAMAVYKWDGVEGLIPGLPDDVITTAEGRLVSEQTPF